MLYFGFNASQSTPDMNVMPVIARELRDQGRRPVTYGLRVIAASAMVALGFFTLFSRGDLLGYGNYMFTLMHTVVFWSIWILVPLSMSDCLSREHREGTLPLLLLLTPMSCQDLVLAKVIAHGLRGFTVVLAVFPVLMVPVLMGGLDWTAVSIAFVINLSAGLLASSRSRQHHRSMVAAMALSALFLSVMILSLGLGLLVPGFLSVMAKELYLHAMDLYSMIELTSDHLLSWGGVIVCIALIQVLIALWILWIGKLSGVDWNRGGSWNTGCD